MKTTDSLRFSSFFSFKYKVMWLKVSLAVKSGKAFTEAAEGVRE